MSEATPKIHAAIGAIMADLEAIPKDRTNKHFGYKFRSFEQVIKTLQPLFIKHGVYPTSEIRNVVMGDLMTTATVVYRLTSCKDGSHVETVVVAQGKDNADKGAYKLMSGALKYAWGQMLMIPFEGDDAENTSNDASKPRVGSENYQTKPALTDSPTGREVITKFNGKGNPPTKALVSSLDIKAAEDALGLAEWRRDNQKGKYAQKNAEEATEDVAALQAHLVELDGAGTEYATSLPEDGPDIGDGPEPPF